MSKRICFCCVTVFHVFLSHLLKKAYFDRDDASMELCLSTEKFGHEINRHELGKLFSLDHGKNRHYDEVFIFTDRNGSFNGYDSFEKGFKKNFVYEGITSFQLKNWLLELNKADQVDLFDEIWTPDDRMMLDGEYTAKLRNFSLREYLRSGDALAECCGELNRVFDYSHRRLDFDVLFFDRYLSISKKITKPDEELLLSMILKLFTTEKSLVKKHPYDRLNKYESFQAKLFDQTVPWELIHLNRLLNKEIPDTETYLIYNSSAPMNNALLFGLTNFKIICVNGVLGKYADIDGSYLDAGVTERILERFSDLYGVPVAFVNGFDALDGQFKSTALTDDALWRAAEDLFVSQEKMSILELRGFRLRLDALLYRLRKTSGSYFCRPENVSTNITRELMAAILPSFRQDENSPDFEIICDDRIRAMREPFIFGANLTTSEGREFAAKLSKAGVLYVWGTAKTNRQTFDILQKACLLKKVKFVLHSNETGFHRGIPVRKFEKSLIDPDSMIIVCAGAAYNEIAGILSKAGFCEGTDYMRGIGL